MIELERVFVLPLAPRWVQHSYLSEEATTVPYTCGLSALRRGKQRLSCAFRVDAQNLNAKERHFTWPLVCEPLLCSPSLLLRPQQVRQCLFLCANKSCIFREQFLLLAPMTTYLKDLTQSIGRYGGLSWQDWFKGFWKYKYYLYLVQRIWLA